MDSIYEIQYQKPWLAVREKLHLKPNVYFDQHFYYVFLDFYWVDSNNRAAFPPNAVEGGRDKDGSIIYVGLANYEGEELPAKLVPARGTAYVPYNGKEVAISNYKVRKILVSF